MTFPEGAEHGSEKPSRGATVKKQKYYGPTYVTIVSIYMYNHRHSVFHVELRQVVYISHKL